MRTTASMPPAMWPIMKVSTAATSEVSRDTDVAEPPPLVDVQRQGEHVAEDVDAQVEQELLRDPGREVVVEAGDDRAEQVQAEVDAPPARPAGATRPGRARRRRGAGRAGSRRPRSPGRPRAARRPRTSQRAAGASRGQNRRTTSTMSSARRRARPGPTARARRAGRRRGDGVRTSVRSFTWAGRVDERGDGRAAPGVGPPVRGPWVGAQLDRERDRLRFRRRRRRRRRPSLLESDLHDGPGRPARGR